MTGTIKWAIFWRDISVHSTIDQGLVHTNSIS
jgi:hypothetical protein